MPEPARAQTTTQRSAQSARAPQPAQSTTSDRSNQAFRQYVASVSTRDGAPTTGQVAGEGGPFATVTAQLTAGDIAGARAGLEGLVASERAQLSGTSDRTTLRQALAALAVVEGLSDALAAKAEGKAPEAQAHATKALGTLARTPELPPALRSGLESAATGFGASADATTQQVATGYDPAIGQALAKASARISGGNPRPGGRCYGRVADAVDAVIGGFLSGGHAYMAAGQLAARKDLFTEIPAGDLTSLPAGALVVWGKGTSKSGHISIALGDGRESSDFVGRQMTRHYGGAGARVFLPHGKMRR
jgi:hypothetical protein